jgi:hypothetical protein
MASLFTRLAIALVAVVVVGCGQQELTNSSLPPQSSDGLEFHERLLEIANSYENYRRISPDRMGIAPGNCRAISSPLHQLALSNSPDSSTHGRKLFAVLVSGLPKGADSGTYVTDGQPNPVGLVVVKESWEPEEVADTPENQKPAQRRHKVKVGDEWQEVVDEYLPYARHDGHLSRAARKSALFIMYKMAPATPGTDQGWVYGTVTGDGTRVLTAGHLENCIGCHRDAPHDRLFGPAKE